MKNAVTSLQSLITATPSPHACSKLMPSRPLLENIILTDLSNHRFRGSDPQQSSATARSGLSSLCSQSSRQRVMMAESISSSTAPLPSATSLSRATEKEKDIASRNQNSSIKYKSSALKSFKREQLWNYVFNVFKSNFDFTYLSKNLCLWTSARQCLGTCSLALLVAGLNWWQKGNN